jgi:hypothetical protein
MRSQTVYGYKFYFFIFVFSILRMAPQTPIFFSIKNSLTPWRNIMLVLLIALTSNAFAQQTYALKDLFLEESFVWYGIDYSKTSFVGNFIGKDLNVYFEGWNRLTTEEPDKYNVKRSMHKFSVVVDLAAIQNINARTSAILSDTDSTLTKSEIAKMVARYSSKEAEGIGFALLAESYNRKTNEGSHYAVIFDIASKKVLLSQRFISPPGGLGVRNFWAFSIYNTFNLVADNYTKWKRKYNK